MQITNETIHLVASDIDNELVRCSIVDGSGGGLSSLKAHPALGLLHWRDIPLCGHSFSWRKPCVGQGDAFLS